MAPPTSPGPGSLARWQRFLGEEDCPCPMAYKSLGVLYGVAMGDGWVRMATDPACRHHGEDRGQSAEPTS